MKQEIGHEAMSCLHRNCGLLSVLSAAILVVVSLLGTPVRAAEPDATGTFLVVTDIHFDPFDPPELAAKLVAANVAEWPGLFRALDRQPMSPYGRDTNQALLESSLAALTAAAGGVDFVVVNGDLLAHRFEEKARDALGTAATDDAVRGLTVKTSRYVADRITSALPGRPVFLALGNNDSSCGDYRIDPGGSYLAGMLATVRDMIGADRLGPDFERTFAAGGYYAARHPSLPDTLVVAVNDILWSAEYRDACGNGGAGAGEAMLDWLGGVLERQRAAGGRVWLIHHIPFGIDAYSTARESDFACPAKTVAFLKEPFASAYLTLLRDNAKVITTSVSGHIHYDGYRLLFDAAGRPVLVDKIVPAISPVFGQNPGFQVFEYDRASGLPNDFSTYYLTNLDKAAAQNPAEGVWQHEYRFTEAYGQTAYAATTVDAIWRAMSADGTLQETFRRLYNVSHGEIRRNALPAYLCAMGHADEAAFGSCFCDR